MLQQTAWFRAAQVPNYLLTLEIILRGDPWHLRQLRHLISSDDLTFKVFSNGAIIVTFVTLITILTIENLN